jgi:deoxycytidylate deaminase
MLKHDLNRIKTKHTNLFDLLIKEAQKSNVQHKHAACIIAENKIISIAHNYVLLRNKYEKNHSIHAEVAAILKLNKKHFLKYKKFKLIVIRISNNKSLLFDTLLLSKPCNNCMNYIKQNNITEVYYS